MKSTRKPILRKTPLKRGGSGSSRKAAKKKTSRASILREYGVPPFYKLRYTSNIYKGIYWYYLARYVRARDARAYGTCISCGKPKTYDELQAGHFAAAGSCGFDLVFDERNVNGECGGCNAYDENHLWGYARNLDLRYGKGTAKKLQDRYDKRHQTTTKEWSQDEYIRRIKEMAKRYNEIALSTG